MTTPLNYRDAGTPFVQNDRRGGLVTYGVISIVIGSIAGCFAALTPLALLTSRMTPTTGPATPKPDARAVVVALILYTLISASFIWTGIASCRRRRWVRPIILSVAWPWLFIGILALFATLVLIPDLQATMRSQPGFPAGAAGIFTAIMIGFMTLLYIALPVAYLLFYQRPDVQLTLDAYDPTHGWTDRCPLPVFGLSINLALLALYSLSQLQVMVAPCFGVFLTGSAATMLLLAQAALLLIAAVLSFRLRIEGWWLALFVTMAINLSWILSALLGDQSAMNARIASTYGGAKVDMARLSSHRLPMSALVTVSMAVCVTYILKIRNRFIREATALQATELRSTP